MNIIFYIMKLINIMNNGYFKISFKKSCKKKKQKIFVVIIKKKIILKRL